MSNVARLPTTFGYYMRLAARADAPAQPVLGPMAEAILLHSEAACAEPTPLQIAQAMAERAHHTLH